MLYHGGYHNQKVYMSGGAQSIFNFEQKKSSDCDDTTRFSGLNSQLKLDFYRG